MAARIDQASGATSAELTALNSHLKETLERQRTTSNDLQNILYSTDVATLFLDTDLNLRFFTPATRSLFSFETSDVGRPLSELASLAPDTELFPDAQAVLSGRDVAEREIAAAKGIWCRRILPCRTSNEQVDGVVITYIDVTHRKHVAEDLQAAKRAAELATLATLAKSRFLAVASHDLRQPLQSLKLLQGLLANQVEGEPAQQLVARMEVTLSAMSGMLNTLLDINQIEAGTVKARIEAFSIDGLLGRLQEEFAYHSQAKGLTLRVIKCGVVIQSDAHLLEQMVRNLLSNAFKYTRRGKVLIGCRRRGQRLAIEIWDTGIGIGEDQLEAIFEEYHQVDNAARERTRGLGLGLAIVASLGKTLGHEVQVRSIPGKGSVFSVQVAIAPTVMPQRSDIPLSAIESRTAAVDASILVVEDDPEIRDLIPLILQAQGYKVVCAADAATALAMIEHGTAVPDLLLGDFNLPGDTNGVQLAASVRQALGRRLPVIILTGDISTETLQTIALENCVYLHKPVKLPDLVRRIDALLLEGESAKQPHDPAKAKVLVGPDVPVIFIVDDDHNVREAIRSVLEAEGMIVMDFADAEAFFKAYKPGQSACLLVDAYLPGADGFELLGRLRDAGHHLPSIMITGASDVPMAVRAMKAGALDFIEKPVGREDLLSSITRAFDQARDDGKVTAWHEAATVQLASLTQRQRQVMEMVLAGAPSKNIAADLGISQRTVENHRASIMKKTGCRSLPALARLALAAAWDGASTLDLSNQQPQGNGNQ